MFLWRPAILLALLGLTIAAGTVINETQLFHRGSAGFVPEDPFPAWERKNYTTTAEQAVRVPSWKSTRLRNEQVKQSELEAWLSRNETPAETEQRAKVNEEMTRRILAFEKSPEGSRWMEERRMVERFENLNASNILYCIGVCLLVAVVVYLFAVGHRWAFMYSHKGWKRLALLAAPMLSLSTVLVLAYDDGYWEFEDAWPIGVAVFLVAAPVILLVREAVLWIRRGFETTS